MVELVSEVKKGGSKQFGVFSDRSRDERYEQINAMLVPGANYHTCKLMVDYLNEESRIGLDDLDREAFALQTQSFVNVLRFLGDPHVSVDNADNVARHYFRVTALGDDLFRNEAHSRPNLELRQKYQLATLMHDMGEVVREFGSFAKEAQEAHELQTNKTLSAEDKKQIKEASKHEIFRIEKKIARFSMCLAFTAALLKDHELYHKVIAELRDKTGVQPDGRLKEDPQQQVSSKQAMEIIDHYIDAYTFPELNDQQQQDVNTRMERLMYFYDRAEDLTQGNIGVLGPIVKIMQKADGSDYIYKVMGKDGAVPYDESWNWRILGAHSRNEAELGKLARHADTQELRDFAAIAQRWMLARSIDLIKKNPTIVSREKEPSEAQMAGSAEMRDAKTQMGERAQSERLSYAQRVGGKGAKAFGRHDPLSHELVTAHEALITYLAAYASISSDLQFGQDAFTLPEQPLMHMRETPEPLKPAIELLDIYIRMASSQPQMKPKELWSAIEKMQDWDVKHQTALTRLKACGEFIHETVQEFRASRREIISRQTETCLRV